jgi:Malectin domain
MCSHTSIGKRIFDASVEGRRIEDIDIVQLGGGVAFKALSRTVLSVSVVDGSLSIVFSDNVPLVRMLSVVQGSEWHAIAYTHKFPWTD